jgi:hypothetical protein
VYVIQETVKPMRRRRAHPPRFRLFAMEKDNREPAGRAVQRSPAR